MAIDIPITKDLLGNAPTVEATITKGGPTHLQVPDCYTFNFFLVGLHVLPSFFDKRKRIATKTN